MTEGQQSFFLKIITKEKKRKENKRKEKKRKGRDAHDMTQSEGEGIEKRLF
jgi:hypothetical protein